MSANQEGIENLVAEESTPMLWNHSNERKSVYYDENDILLGQKIARALSKYEWYNPSRKSEGTPPSLALAWAYFEHSALPRYYYLKDKPGVFNRAPAGEKNEPTKLYPLWGTSAWEMGDFGSGVGMYFLTIRYFIVVTFVAGLLSLPNNLYFRSTAYGSPLGTALCSNVHWRPCPTCDQDNWESPFSRNNDRYATGFSTSDGSSLTFIKVNECELNPRSGYVSLVVLIFVITAVWVYMRLQKKIRAILDDEEDTCADYSLEILNPPSNCEHARDPEIWKEFFEDKFPGTSVKMCTVALQNYELQDALIKRRKLLSKLEHLFGDDKKEIMTNRGALAEVMENKSDSSEFAHYEKILDLDVKIDELCQQEYDASRVFITFEKEEMQRAVLTEMTVPIGRPGLLDEKYRFYGHVLTLVEAEEPSGIIWNDYYKPFLSWLFELTISFTISFIVTALAGYLIYVARERSTFISTIAIILLNVCTPQVAKFISSFESHGSQTSLSASIYIKVAFIRWVNTALVYFLITPFTHVLGEQGLVPAILALLKGEVLIRAPLQLSDWRQQIFRHYFGPRASDQKSMNLNFQGGGGGIETRYTEVTKILFLAFFSCELIPGVFFYASVILVSYYMLDKFCFLRAWGQGPRVGAQPALISVYFFLLAIIVYAFMAFYFYAQFPFDNARKTTNTMPTSYLGNVTISDLNGGQFDLTVTPEDAVYEFVDKFIWRHLTFFPKIEAADWMESAQASFANMYRWIFVVIFSLMVITIISRFVLKFLRVFLVKSFSPVGSPTDNKFSDVNVDGYVPQVEIPGVEYPMLLCDVDELPKKLIGWTDDSEDSEDNFDRHNLLLHAPEFKKFTFSVVKYWD